MHIAKSKAEINQHKNRGIKIKTIKNFKSENHNDEFDGKTVRVYDSMWEYVKDFDFESMIEETLCDMDICYVKEFTPCDFFSIYGSYVIINGKGYFYVNWGEEETCFIPEKNIDDVFYCIMIFCDEFYNESFATPNTYISFWDIYNNEYEAEKAAQNLVKELKT